MLGEPRPARLLAELTTGELAHWAAYLELDPPALEVIEGQLATLCAIVSSGLGARAEPADFLPRPRPRRKPVDEVWGRMMAGLGVLRRDDDRKS